MPDRKRPARPVAEMAEAAREIRERGWSVGPGGSFSVLLARKPVRLCITSADRAGEALDDTDLLEIDDDAEILHGFGRPADETLLHLTVYRHCPRARCILFSRSVAGTVIADRHFTEGGITFRGYEAVRGLAGERPDPRAAKVPIIDGSADHLALAHVLENVLIDGAGVNAVLIRGNGLYTWGETADEAKRAVEILEFLFEVQVHSGR